MFGKKTGNLKISNFKLLPDNLESEINNLKEED